MRAALLILSTLIAMTALAAPGAAQQRVVGVVTDSTSGAPLAGASVRLATAGVEEETDASGAFEIVARTRAADTLVVHRIGYLDVRRVVELGGEPRPDTVHARLQPDPVMLAALRVVGRSVPTSVRGGCTGCCISVVPPIRGFGVVQLLEDRVGYRRERCSGAEGQPAVYCTALRGRVEPVELYVDGNRAAGGLDDAARYPLSAVYSITLSGDRSAVFLVTNREMERAARDHLRATGKFP